MAMNAPGPARDARLSLRELEQHRGFVDRHIGTDDVDQAAMLRTLGFATRGALIDAIVPAAIRSRKPLALPAAKGEEEALRGVDAVSRRRTACYTTYIGQGYYGTYTPGVILRNVLENPAWYTAYTPYQPEISQGRLEALVNFQTMICDLTGMAIANASMLDEATAAAEGMTLCRRVEPAVQHATLTSPTTCCRRRSTSCRTRAAPLGIAVTVGDRRWRRRRPTALRSCCNTRARRRRARLSSQLTARLHAKGALVIAAVRPARADAADAARRMGRRRRRRLEPALRRADGIRRPACGVPRHARRIQAQSSWTAGRRQRRRQRRPARIDWRCRRASSTSAAKRRRPTSAPRRCCSP